MAELPHIIVDGMPLPVHSTDDVLWGETQYDAAMKDGLERFVRIASPYGHAPELSLPKRLRHVDLALQAVAKHCGISVVPYDWGVCRDRPDMFKSYPRADAKGLLPEGFLLVAEVTCVIPVEHSFASFDEVFNRMNDSQTIEDLIADIGDGVSTPYCDYDMEQVMYGRLATNPNDPPEWYYVDPDPLLNAA